MTYKLIKREIRKNPKVHTGKEHWSQAQKLEAVSAWMMTGSWAAVNAATNIPVDTLKHWKMQDWWKDAVAELRQASNTQMSGKLQKIISKSADIILDRLENGDIHFNPKTGEISRKEINAKIASEILHKSVDKELLLQKVEQAPQLKEEAIMDRLKAIQQELSKNAKKHKPINVIDVEVIDDGQTGRLQAESDQYSVGSDEVERGDGSEVREGSGTELPSPRPVS